MLPVHKIENEHSTSLPPSVSVWHSAKLRPTVHDSRAAETQAEQSAEETP